MLHRPSAVVTALTPDLRGAAIGAVDKAACERSHKTEHRTFDMPDFRLEIDRTIRRFLDQVTSLARSAAVATLRGSSTEPSWTARTAAARPAGRPPGRRGKKRTAADLALMAYRFETFVRRNPGLRIEQINRQLETTTKELALPIQKLIADGGIRAEGRERSTTYFPANR
jgi:hypothetical protein